MKLRPIYKSDRIALVYLARGKDLNFLMSFKKFLFSYKKYNSGVQHDLYIIFKGFNNKASLEKAEYLVKSLRCKKLYLEDKGFCTGSYLEAAKKIDSNKICFLKTSSRILSDNWLLKLSINLDQPNVGLVGATASFESLHAYNTLFPVFPNPHIRTSGFMIKRKYFIRLCSELRFESKHDTWLFESGPFSLTNKIYTQGKEAILVGRNGRGYTKNFWSGSNIFRMGLQDNLLIADNVTDFYIDSTSAYKNTLSFNTWG
jgi:hypothetical protein